MISIQNEREWANFCRVVLDDELLSKDNGHSVEVPAAPCRMEWDEPEFRGAPQIGQHRVLPVAAELNVTEV